MLELEELAPRPPRARDFAAPRVLFFAVDRLEADFDEARLVVLFRVDFFAVLFRLADFAELFFAVLLRPAFFAPARLVADLRVIDDDAPFLAVERLDVDLRVPPFFAVERFDADFLVVAAM